MNDNYFEYKDNFIQYGDVKSKMILGNPNRKNRLFTIAIPTYKRPELLENALISALNQVEIDDYEIVIVDNDYSSSATEKIVEKNLNENVYYFKNEKNIGLFGNWNRCIELAKGEYITILNDDDWLSENYLMNCMKYLKPEVDGLYFLSNIVDLRHNNVDLKHNNTKDRKKKYLILKKIIKTISKKSKKMKLFDFFLENRSNGTLGVLMKTSNLKKLGGYNQDYFPSSDYVLHANYCYNYNVYFINERLNYYRIAVNVSAKQETLQKWEHLDVRIKDYFIEIIGKRKKILKYMNLLITENRIEGMEKQWNYETQFQKKHYFMRTLLKLLVRIKYQLNI
jgi:glycosyltransferase involved in cell wall biosynthesis